MISDLMNESVRFVCAPADKLLLEQLAKRDSHKTGERMSISATLRRLIREEARRRKLAVDVQMIEEAA